MPESVEMPAPVRTTIHLERSTSAAAILEPVRTINPPCCHEEKPENIQGPVMTLLSHELL